MGFYNSGGLITRGYGDDHRIITRGYGVRFDFGGIRLIRKSEKYVFDILVPILKEDYQEIGIYSPLEIRGSRNISINSSVSKETEESINLLASMDYSKLSEVLDAI